MPLSGTTATVGTSTVTVYKCTRPDQKEKFKNKRLTMDASNPSAPYRVMTVPELSGSMKTVVLRPDDVSDRVPDGWWDFVVTVEQMNVILLRRNYLAKQSRAAAKGLKRTDPGCDRGHTSIAQGKDVIFAGGICFGGADWYGKNDSFPQFRAGQMVKWTNGSGHYLVGEGLKKDKLKDHVATQTAHLIGPNGKPFLPMDLFEPEVKD